VRSGNQTGVRINDCEPTLVLHIRTRSDGAGHGDIGSQRDDVFGTNFGPQSLMQSLCERIMLHAAPGKGDEDDRSSRPITLQLRRLIKTCEPRGHTGTPRLPRMSPQ
jgi:hypothetical protein